MSESNYPIRQAAGNYSKGVPHGILGADTIDAIKEVSFIRLWGSGLNYVHKALGLCLTAKTIKKKKAIERIQPINLLLLMLKQRVRDIDD